MLAVNLDRSMPGCATLLLISFTEICVSESPTMNLGMVAVNTSPASGGVSTQLTLMLSPTQAVEGV